MTQPINFNFKKSSIVFLLLLFLIIPLKLEGRSLFGECISTSVSNPQSVTLTPLKKACHDDCSNECSIFSQTDSSKNTLNKEIISQCIAECQRGNAFTSRYAQEETVNGEDVYVYQAAITVGIQSSCSSSDRDDNKVATGFKGKYGDGFKLLLNASSSEDQKIYLCGKNHIKVKPVFYFDKNQNQVLNNCSSGTSTSECKTQNILTADMGNSAFSNLQSTSYTGSTAMSWHSQNNVNFFNTGIEIAKNDELAIKWTGEHSLWSTYMSSEDKPYYTTIRQAIINASNNSSYDKNELKRRWRLGSYLYAKVNGVTQTLMGETDDDQGPRLPSFDFDSFGREYFYTDEYSDHEGYYRWGLRAYYQDKGIEFDTSGCDEDDPSEDCATLSDPGTGRYWYTGTLNSDFESEFGGGRGTLHLRQFDPGGIADNWGGYELEIEHGGCPFSEGEQIQYAFLPEGENASTYDFESKWQDLDPDYLGTVEILIDQFDLGDDEGELYLRINTTPPDSYNSGLLHLDPGNLHGAYELTVGDSEYQGTFSGAIGPLTKIIYYTYESMYKITTLIYETVVKDSAFIQILNIILIIYLAGTGFAFMAGTVERSMKEVVNRMLKLSIVVFITAPATIENIFSEWILAYLIGLLSTIYNMTSIILPDNFILSVSNQYSLTGQSGSFQPHSIFMIFDFYLEILFDKNTWLKLWALFTSNVLNAILFTFIMFGIGMSILTLVKLLVIFLYSIIGISLLFIILPVFSVFLLFKITKGFFDSWWKYFLSWSIQPVAIMIIVTMIITLLIILLSKSLNFSVCTTNGSGLLQFITVWAPILNSSVPEGVDTSEFSPVLLQVGLLYIMLSYMAYAIMDKISEIISALLTGPVRSAQAAKGFSDTKSAAKGFAKKLKPDK